jgi:DNA-binding MarR family transcriptional regulator
VEKRTCASDARVTYAALTPAGRDKLKQASRSHVASVHALFSAHFSDAEVATLAGLLERLGSGAADPGECTVE